MRKSTKLAILVAALVAICSFAAVAAAGWVNEGGEWYYVDKNGDYVSSEWKASEGNYYWLGEDGAMLRGELIQDGEYTYYVAADGARVHDAWIQVAADDADLDLDVEYRWYRFQSNGKAIKNKTATIDGQKYHFDEDGKMVFGFVDENCEIINDSEDKPLGATYYFGTNETGAMYTGWLKYEDGFTTTDDYDNYSEVWFYFNEKANGKGKKVTSLDPIKINGQQYTFDERGVMQSGWVVVTTNSTLQDATYSKYFSAAEDGHLVKSEWIYKVPSTDINAKDNDEDNKRWFRTDKKGFLLRDTTAKINGKYYTFKDDAIMLSGLQFMTLKDDAVAGSSSPTNYKATGADVDIDAVKTPLAVNEELFYFSGDEENDGSMKTGTYKIEVSDETYTFTFDSHGRARKGEFKNKVYVNGLLLDAGDMRYTVVENVYAGKKDHEDEQPKYLVSATGTIISGKKYVKDADDDYYATFVGEDGVQHCIKVKDSDDAAKIAKQFTKDGILLIRSDVTWMF